MKISTNRFDSGSKLGKSVKDIDGFKSYHRFVILSEIVSDTIPDIMDLIFNLLPGGSGVFINENTKKTRVTVINTSEVHGDVHGTRNTRTRNALIHYGFADVNIDNIHGETPISFVDMDWNVIVDKPWDTHKSVSAVALAEVKVSYDVKQNGGVIYRDSKDYRRISIPDPVHYDEKDQLLLSDNDSDYFEHINDNREINKFHNFRQYMNGLYTCSLNDLIDDHTKIVKLNISIENLTSGIKSFEEIDEFNQYITELVSQGKYILETCGFSGCELILKGRGGFTVNNFSSHMSLSKDEVGIIRYIMLDRFSSLNDTISDDDPEIIITYSYSNVKVKIFDKIYIPNHKNETGQLGDVLGQQLKLNQSTFEPIF